MCCLKYEQECYDIMHKQMPTVGTECVTVDGSGVVIENNVITERTKVKVTLADGTLDVRSYPFNELNYVNKNGVRCCGCDECGGSCCGNAEGDGMQQQAASKPDSSDEAEKEAEAEERRQALLAEREKKEKEEYAKKIQQDRIELMRLKQGVITESDTIYEEKEEKPKMSFWKKLGNFLYHSKWWLGITVFIVGVFVFLIVDYVTKVRPDMIVLLITDDTEMQNHRQQLEEYLEQFTDDENGDGKVHVDIYPIPVSDNIDDMDYFTGNSTKLSAEFQMGEAVMVITDAKANEYIMADETLTDLSEKYTGHENIRGNGYYLRHTDFATKIDYPGNVDRDLSIGLRAPVKTSDSKEKMQKTYDVAEKVLLRVMDDLDNTTEPEDIVATEPAETAVTTTKED